MPGCRAAASRQSEKERKKEERHRTKSMPGCHAAAAPSWPDTETPKERILLLNRERRERAWVPCGSSTEMVWSPHSTVRSGSASSCAWSSLAAKTITRAGAVSSSCLRVGGSGGVMNCDIVCGWVVVVVVVWVMRVWGGVNVRHGVCVEGMGVRGWVWVGGG